MAPIDILKALVLKGNFQKKSSRRDAPEPPTREGATLYRIDHSTASGTRTCYGAALVPQQEQTPGAATGHD